MIKQLNEPIPIELIEFKSDEFVIIAHKHSSQLPFSIGAVIERGLHIGRFNETLTILATFMLFTLRKYWKKRINRNKNKNIFKLSAYFSFEPINYIRIGTMSNLYIYFFI